MEPQGLHRFRMGGTCFGMFVWSYFRLPETWNRTYHALDILFAKKIHARQFAATMIDPFGLHSSEDDLIAAATKSAAKDTVRAGSIVEVRGSDHDGSRA